MKQIANHNQTNPSPLKGAAAIEYLEETLTFPLTVLNRFPKYFLIEPINMCNARCIMCGIDFDKKVTAVLPDELLDKIAGELENYQDHVEKVMLYLDCEPLMDRNLHLKIARLKRSGVSRVNIATNASILTQTRSRAIIEAGLDEIYISIDSLDKATFEAIRLRLNFDKVYKNTVDFIKLRDELNPNLVVRMQMIQQESNYHEADAFTEHWSKLLKPTDQIAVQKAHNWANAIDVMKFGDEETANNIPCIALWGTLCIHANGDVGLCCMDTTSSILLGNVNNESIADIWSGKPMQEIREKHLDGRRHEIEICNGCTLWRESKRDLKRTLGVD